MKSQKSFNSLQKRFAKIQIRNIVKLLSTQPIYTSLTQFLNSEYWFLDSASNPHKINKFRETKQHRYVAKTAVKNRSPGTGHPPRQSHFWVLRQPRKRWKLQFLLNGSFIAAILVPTRVELLSVFKRNRSNETARTAGP